MATTTTEESIQPNEPSTAPVAPLVVWSKVKRQIVFSSWSVVAAVAAVAVRVQHGLEALECAVYRKCADPHPERTGCVLMRLEQQMLLLCLEVVHEVSDSQGVVGLLARSGVGKTEYSNGGFHDSKSVKVSCIRYSQCASSVSSYTWSVEWWPFPCPGNT